MTFRVAIPNQTVPILVAIGAYLVIGFFFSIVSRYHLTKHLWRKHKVLERPSIFNEGYESAKNCWCNIYSMWGDVLFSIPMLSCLFWPFYVAILTVAAPFLISQKALGFMDRLALREPKAKPPKVVEGVWGGCSSGQYTPKEYEAICRSVKNDVAPVVNNIFNQFNQFRTEVWAEIEKMKKRQGGDVSAACGKVACPDGISGALGPGPCPQGPKGPPDIELTVEEEFKKRTGRVLGGDVG